MKCIIDLPIKRVNSSTATGFLSKNNNTKTNKLNVNKRPVAADYID